MDLITENSLLGYKTINEATTESDIASFEEIINRLIEDKYKTSLAYQICEVQPLNSAAGAIFVAKRKTGTYDLEIVKQPVTLEKDTADTSMTKEAFDDINAMFKGKRAVTLIKNILKGASDEKENTRIINLISSLATASAGIIISSSDNAETTVYHIQQKVGELIVKINENSHKTLNGYAILPQKAAGAFLGWGWTDKETKDGSLSLGQKGKVRYFINPDKTATDVYVGVVDKLAVGKSSLVFSPYQYILNKAINPEDGSSKVFMINRYAITENPLSDVSPMIYKFTPTYA